MSVKSYAIKRRKTFFSTYSPLETPSGEYGDELSTSDILDSTSPIGVAVNVLENASTNAWKTNGHREPLPALSNKRCKY